MTIPLIHGIHHDTDALLQVLVHNVEVRDGAMGNSVLLSSLNDADRARFGPGIANSPFRLWRHFVPGVLSAAAQHAYYSPAQRDAILGQYQER